MYHMSQTIESILSVVNILLEMLEKKTGTCLQIQAMEQEIQTILSVLKRLLMVLTIECQRCCISNHVLTSLARIQNTAQTLEAHVWNIVTNIHVRVMTQCVEQDWTCLR